LKASEQFPLSPRLLVSGYPNRIRQPWNTSGIIKACAFCKLRAHTGRLHEFRQILSEIRVNEASGPSQRIAVENGLQKMPFSTVFNAGSCYGPPTLMYRDSENMKPPGPQHPGNLSECCQRVWDMFQDILRNDDVEEAVRKGQALQVFASNSFQIFLARCNAVN
jgi:hypothetical protein